jgi:hypothetical protein
MSNVDWSKAKLVQKNKIATSGEVRWTATIEVPIEDEDTDVDVELERVKDAIATLASAPLFGIENAGERLFGEAGAVLTAGQIEDGMRIEVERGEAPDDGANRVGSRGGNRRRKASE